MEFMASWSTNLLPASISFDGCELADNGAIHDNITAFLSNALGTTLMNGGGPGPSWKVSWWGTKLENIAIKMGK